MSDSLLEAEATITPPTNGANMPNQGDTAPAPIKAEDMKIEDVQTEDVKVEEIKAENSDTEGKDTEVNGTSTIKKEDVEDEKKPRTYDNGILKTSRRADANGDYKKNSKYDPSVLPETDDAREIRKQVEFYFSDSNLPTDTYMWGLTDGTTNLPVSIENISKFGRMKRFKPVSAIIAALRDSHFLDVSGAEGQEQIKRKIPYDPTTIKKRDESSIVYVKGFGDEEPSTQFDIEAFFAPYGPTSAVRLRRTPEKLFKGSVFVEFDNEQTAKNFLALDPKPLWKGKHELLIDFKKDYAEKKLEAIRNGTVQPKETYVHGRGRGGRGRGHRGGDRDNRGGGRGRGDRENGRRGDRDNAYRGDRDPDDWKKRRDDDRASGFKDQRGGRDNRDRKSRGRGGRRDDRGHRSDDRNRERNQKKEDKPEAEAKHEAETPEKKNGEDSRPAKDIKTESPEKSEKKRGREDGEADYAPAAKKADIKSQVAAEAS